MKCPSCGKEINLDKVVQYATEVLYECDSTICATIVDEKGNDVTAEYYGY